MADAVERLVNLAFYLAEAHEPVSAERIRVDVAGYPAEQDQDAFLRMFERDKDILREAGFAIVANDAGSYLIDRGATFAADVELSPDEAAAIRAAGTALLGDPSFPFASDLRLALAKIASSVEGGQVSSAARLADEEPERQGDAVAVIADAAKRSKRVAFGYTNSRGASAPHSIEPYGLFLHDGRWYAVGRDVAKGEVRTYTVARMSDIEVDATRPKSVDFERPVDFDVAGFSRLPFQYGVPAEEFEAVVGFDPAASWRATTLTGGRGTLEFEADGSTVWRVSVRDRARLARFVLENGPGLTIAEPTDAAADLRTALEEVARVHGR